MGSDISLSKLYVLEEPKRHELILWDGHHPSAHYSEMYLLEKFLSIQSRNLKELLENLFPNPNIKAKNIEMKLGSKSLTLPRGMTPGSMWEEIIGFLTPNELTEFKDELEKLEPNLKNRVSEFVTERFVTENSAYLTHYTSDVMLHEKKMKEVTVEMMTKNLTEDIIDSVIKYATKYLISNLNELLSSVKEIEKENSKGIFVILFFEDG
ncbi:MAG: hypothetical protein HY364_01000 [Candidatus Aenigmarchaeota archaeon]|nr:hypothetical protein [Candidatus Aenigmarchaeota archaeon]